MHGARHFSSRVLFTSPCSHQSPSTSGSIQELSLFHLQPLGLNLSQLRLCLPYSSISTHSILSTTARLRARTSPSPALVAMTVSDHSSATNEEFEKQKPAITKSGSSPSTTSHPGDTGHSAISERSEKMLTVDFSTPLAGAARSERIRQMSKNHVRLSNALFHLICLLITIGCF